MLDKQKKNQRKIANNFGLSFVRSNETVLFLFEYPQQKQEKYFSVTLS